MKFAFKSIVIAAAFAAAGLANAAPFTLAVGGSVTDQGFTIGGLSGTSTWSFSGSLIDLLNGHGTQEVAAIDPAAVTTTMKAPPKGYQYKTVSIAAPVQSVSGTTDGTTVSINQVVTTGGALLTFSPDGFGEWGILGISNMVVNLDNKKVYADLYGYDHLSTGFTITNVEMWDITTINGATSFAAAPGTNTMNYSLTGLKINPAAFALFSQVFGQTLDGENALRNVTDFGTINTTISVASVPEPSAYAMIGMGLLVTGAVGRRRKASMSQLMS